jgi:hypothetical protein
MMKVAERLGDDVRGIREHFPEVVIPWRRVMLYMALCLGFFLLGFLPPWLMQRDAAEQRDAAQREVRLGQLQNTLSSAVVDAQRGEFETARQTSSDFYMNLRRQMDRGGESPFTADQREMLKPIVSQRDEIITLLARSDPAAADRLFALYSSYLKIMSIGQQYSGLQGSNDACGSSDAVLAATDKRHPENAPTF